MEPLTFCGPKWAEVPNAFASDISAVDVDTSVGYITFNLQVSRSSEDEGTGLKESG